MKRDKYVYFPSFTFPVIWSLFTQTHTFFPDILTAEKPAILYDIRV